MIPRLRPVLAIARRDLLQELRGRRGGVVIAVTALLLGPIALAPTREATVASRAPRVVLVSGDLPAQATADPHLQVVPPGRAAIHVIRQPDGTRVVRSTQGVPGALRRALDGPEPAVRTEIIRERLALPRRSVLLGLIAASVLTGALAESVPGERSRKTLQTLLAAAVSRTEIITGKWLAWAGYGTLAALLATVATVALGRQPLGWWVAPLCTVPAATVALGLFLVRRASDVVSGASVSLRVLPAVLGGLGVSAWWIGQETPWLGALVPFGGALAASGDVWAGAAIPLLATASTAGTTAVLLALGARDLDDVVPEHAGTRPGWMELAWALPVLAAAWWLPVLGPLLWASAGNAQLLDDLRPGDGIAAGSLGLLLFALVRGGRAASPGRAVGLGHAGWRTWPLAAAAGLLLALGTPLPALLPEGAVSSLAHERLVQAAHPAHLSAGALGMTVLAQELVFRGALQRVAGPLAAVVGAVLVLGPTDPLQTGATALALSGLVAASGSVAPALVARAVTLLLAPLVPELPAWSGALVLLGAALPWVAIRARARVG